MGQQPRPQTARSSFESQPNADQPEHFKRNLLERFFLRFHMTLLLAGVFSSGLIASKLLLELGVQSMLQRYLTAVCVAYAVFFILIRIWLSYIASCTHAQPSKREPDSTGVDFVDVVDPGYLSVDISKVTRIQAPKWNHQQLEPGRLLLSAVL